MDDDKESIHGVYFETPWLTYREFDTGRNFYCDNRNLRTPWVCRSVIDRIYNIPGGVPIKVCLSTEEVEDANEFLRRGDVFAEVYNASFSLRMAARDKAGIDTEGGGRIWWWVEVPA